MSFYDDFYSQESKKTKKFNIKKLSLNSVKKIIASIIVFILLFIIINLLSVKKEYDFSYDIYNLPAPIQSRTTGDVTKNVMGTTVNISFVADYSIFGRVVDTVNYWPLSINDSLSPKDVALAWGSLADDNVLDCFYWASTNNRFTHYLTKDNRWRNYFSSLNEVDVLYSNNHLIPADDNIKSKISAIKNGDYIKMDGYLVNVFYNTKNMHYTWNSSVTRTDTGDGACEVFYVTNITWLK